MRLDLRTRVQRAWEDFDPDAGPELTQAGGWRTLTHAAVACLLVHLLLAALLAATAQEHQFFRSRACGWVFALPTLADGLVAAAAMACYGWARGEKMTNNAGTPIGGVVRYGVFPLLVGAIAGTIFLHAVPFALNLAVAHPARVTATIESRYVQHVKSGVKYRVDAGAFDGGRWLRIEGLEVDRPLFDAIEVDDTLLLVGKASWLGLDVQGVRRP